MSEPNGMTSQEIYERLEVYKQNGIVEYVLPTEPLGEQWILGIDGLGIAKFASDADVIHFIVGTENMIRIMAKRQGIRL